MPRNSAKAKAETEPAGPLEEPRRRRRTSAPPTKKKLTPQTLPLLPIRDQVYFPHMIFPLLVGREKSVRALEDAIASQRHIMLVAQRRVDTEDPDPGDLYSIGIAAEVLQILRVPDGTVRVMLEGIERVRTVGYIQEGPFFKVVAEPL